MNAATRGQLSPEEALRRGMEIAQEEGVMAEHIRLTKDGATHWSSGPGNLTFDPECPACWEASCVKLEAQIEYLQAREARLLKACKELLALRDQDMEHADWATDLPWYRLRTTLAALMSV